MQTFPPSLRIAQSVATLAGADDSLESINTTELSDGALVVVQQNGKSYRLAKASTATADSPDIIAPAQGGPGRWFSQGAGATLFQNINVVRPAIGAQSSADVAFSILGVTDSSDIVVANLTDTGLPTGIGVGPIRVTGTNAAVIRFVNATGGTVAGATTTFVMAVLEGAINAP